MSPSAPPRRRSARTLLKRARDQRSRKQPARDQRAAADRKLRHCPLRRRGSFLRLAAKQQPIDGAFAADCISERLWRRRKAPVGGGRETFAGLVRQFQPGCDLLCGQRLRRQQRCKAAQRIGSDPRGELGGHQSFKMLQAFRCDLRQHGSKDLVLEHDPHGRHRVAHGEQLQQLVGDAFAR
jgi:hypothetical protein